MEQLLIYLLKSSALLSIFFLTYQLLLRNDTSFHVNRIFLLAGILISLLLPLVEFTRIVEVEAQALPIPFPAAAVTSELPDTPQPAMDWWLIVGIIYSLGLCFFLLRIFFQIVSLFKIFRKGARTKEGPNVLIHSEKQVPPFSFFRNIVVNPARHTEEELRIILKHEQVHASQWHSADVVFSNLAAAIHWFNPLSWWYKDSLVQNLEYIADKETVAAVPKKEYQHSLVRFSVVDYQPALANNFYQSLIKKRIIMLNKKPSQNLSLLKISAVIPFICAFMLFFNVRTQAQEETTLAISYSEDSSIGIGEISPESSRDFLKEIGEAPLFVINYKQYKSEDLAGKSIELMGSISILSKEEAQSNYGAVARDGAIIIGEGKIIDDFKTALQKIDEEGLPVKKQYIKVLKGEKPMFVELEKTTDRETLTGAIIPAAEDTKASVKPHKNVRIIQTDSIKPLYIVDGKILSEDFDLNSIDPDDIATINVLKGAHAIEAYGKKGKNGVIMINLKESSENNDPSNLTLVFNEKNPNAKNILFVLNGKVMDTSFEAHKVEADNIETIHVLKSESAIEKYGEKAKDGVIEITTKDKS